MTRNLAEVFEAAMAADVRALEGVAPSASALATTVRRVRRRRRVRTGVESVSVAAAVTGIAAVAWWGQRGGPVSEVPPATAPDVTSSATASPTTSAPTEREDALVVPGLPETYALTDAVLAQAGPGWALGQYRAVPVDGNPDEPVVNQLVVAAPDGTAYRAAELPAEWRLRMVRWDPGSREAIVQVARGLEEFEIVEVRARLDVMTGTMTPDAAGLPDDAMFLGLDSAGRELWRGAVPADAQPDTQVGLYLVAGTGPARELGQTPPFARVYVSPFRPWVFLDAGVDAPYATQMLVDTDAGTVTDAGLDGCSALGWLAANRLLATCGAPQGGATAGATLTGFTISPSGVSGSEVLHEFAAGEQVPYPELGGSVGGGVAFVGTPRSDTECVSTAYVWRAGRLDVLQGPRTADDRVLVRGGPSGFVVESAPTCTGAPWVPTVTLHRTDGAAVDLLPVPAAGGRQWGEGLVAWLVVGGPTG